MENSHRPLKIAYKSLGTEFLLYFVALMLMTECQVSFKYILAFLSRAKWHFSFFLSFVYACIYLEL